MSVFSHIVKSLKPLRGNDQKGHRVNYKTIVFVASFAVPVVTFGTCLGMTKLVGLGDLKKITPEKENSMTVVSTPGGYALEFQYPIVSQCMDLSVSFKTGISSASKSYFFLENKFNFTALNVDSGFKKYENLTPQEKYEGCLKKAGVMRFGKIDFSKAELKKITIPIDKSDVVWVQNNQGQGGELPPSSVPSSIASACSFNTIEKNIVPIPTPTPTPIVTPVAEVNYQKVISFGIGKLELSEGEEQVFTVDIELLPGQQLSTSRLSGVCVTNSGTEVDFRAPQVSLKELSSQVKRLTYSMKATTPGTCYPHEVLLSIDDGQRFKEGIGSLGNQEFYVIGVVYTEKDASALTSLFGLLNFSAPASKNIYDGNSKAQAQELKKKQSIEGSKVLDLK